MTGSDDSGVELPTCTEQEASDGNIASEKNITTLDDDPNPVKTVEGPVVPEPAGAGKPMSGDVKDLDQEDDDANISDGSDVDEILELQRMKYEDMEPRIKLAPKRVKQMKQYTSILEERLSLLEQRVTLFDRKLRKMPEDADALQVPPPPPEEEKQVYLKPELNFQLLKNFKHRHHVPLIATHQIDVFVGELDTQKTDKFRRRKIGSKAMTDDGIDDLAFLYDPKSGPLDKSSDERRLTEELGKLKNKHLPSRIRINGSAILWLFHKFLSSGNSALDDVILRPFKPLLQNKEDIHNVMSHVVAELTRIIDQRAEKNAGLSEDAEQSDETVKTHPVQEAANTTETPTGQEKSKSSTTHSAPDVITIEEWDAVLTRLGLFDESAGCYGRNMVPGWPTLSEVKMSFECIRGLFDKYLLPGHMEYRERKAKKVRFNDLWHLFHTGDLVVTKRLANLDGTETQGRLGMRVLMTAGGRNVIATKLPAPVVPSSINLLPSVDEARIEPINGVNPFCIYSYYLDFNGSKLVPVRRRIVIAPYPGERNISDLEITPIEYDVDSAGILNRRGKRFVDFVTASTAPYVDCKGLELRTREELNDKVIVDMKGYLSTNPGDTPMFDEPEELDVSETSDCFEGKDCMYSGWSCYHRTPIVQDQITDLAAYREYIEDRPLFNPLSGTQNAGLIEPSDFGICHYRVFAYKLRSREWVQVNVTDLEIPPETEKGRGFSKLVLSEDHKHILESQVREHFRKRVSQASGGSTENDMDLVRGKGQGLIILLHGAPGVGKTCTAECIADLVEKPLYPITCGDLGSSAEAVEEGLKKHFTLASRWDCVMLLDEADVFLAKRKLEDLQRNSIVSVFLRMLEYYKGLLFLTTNRVGTFDEAFTSRVHISLFYPDFDKKTTLAVWKTFIEQTEHVLKINGRNNVTIAGAEIMKFAEKHFDKNQKASWNGRQIRNAFHTAVAMAEFAVRKSDGSYNNDKDATIRVGKAEFKKIAKTAEEFEDYMEETTNGTFRAKASKAGLRKEQKVQKEKSDNAEKKKKKKKQPKPKSESEPEGSDSEAEDSSE